jgi:flagellar hook-basal body complex protein FliE
MNGISLPPLKALDAYRTAKTGAAPLAPVAPGAPGYAGAAEQSSFGNMISDGARQALGTVRESERMQMMGVRGQASAQEVVRAVMAAETTIQAVVAVRDRVVQAYQEISRMAV